MTNEVERKQDELRLAKEAAEKANDVPDIRELIAEFSAALWQGNYQLVIDRMAPLFRAVGGYVATGDNDARGFAVMAEFLDNTGRQMGEFRSVPAWLEDMQKAQGGERVNVPTGGGVRFRSDYDVRLDGRQVEDVDDDDQAGAGEAEHGREADKRDRKLAEALKSGRRLARILARVEAVRGDAGGRHDDIERPAHYARFRGVQPIELAEQLPFNLGNVVKYACRAGWKSDADEIKDLEKAIQYLEFEIARVVRELRDDAEEGST